MGYSDPKYHTRVLVPALLSKAITVNSTGSAQAATGVAVLPKFVRATKIGAVRVTCVATGTAPDSACAMTFLNGTSTFASVVIGTMTAGQVSDATLTTSAATLAANGQPTVNFTAVSGTGASLACGTWNVEFEQQEVFA